MTAARSLATFCSIGISIFISGCLDTEEKIMLNPDGSGKALIRVKTSAALNIGFGEKREEASDMARQFAVKTIASAEGVDAWFDVAYSQNEKGDLEFSGIAYFSDLNQFSAGSMGGGDPVSGNEKSGWKMSADGGAILLSYIPPSFEDGAAFGEPPADVGEKVAEMRENFRESELVMKRLLADYNGKMGIKVAGEIQSVMTFEKLGKDVASIAYSGEGLVDAIEEVLMDDKLVRELTAKGAFAEGDQATPPREVFERLYGGSVFEIRFVPGQALFDYRAEVAKVNAAMTADFKSLLDEAEKEREGGKE